MNLPRTLFKVVFVIEENQKINEGREREQKYEMFLVNMIANHLKYVLMKLTNYTNLTYYFL